MRILLLFLLMIGCSGKKNVTDDELRSAQNERNQKVMLEYGHLIIPPNFDNIPSDIDSKYEAPKVEKKWYEFF